MKLWPHQQYAYDAVGEHQRNGDRAVVVASPTGAGKTLLQQMEIERGGRVSHYSNRRWLLEQTSGVLDRAGIPHGIRMSGHKPRLLEDVQLSSVQTERSRVYEKERWQLHDADRAIVDEAHLHTNGVSERIVNDHKSSGAFVVGYTATPLELSHLYDGIVVAGTNSELRKCGAHLPCHVFGCGEMDTSKIQRVANGEFSIEQIRKKVWNQKIYGHVLEHHRRLNPDMLPAIGFAPGVPEATWLAEKYCEAGVPAAAIDGDNVWADGESHKSSQEKRQEVVERWRDGEIKIVWNRFVLREGLDFPWLYHLILATPIGSLTSYIQTVGRVLRYWPEYDHVIVQDHGGNSWRHGSPNEDRDWESIWHLRNKTITDMRIDGMREKQDPQPIECPKCGAYRLSGPKCWNCKFEYTGNRRMVLQSDGELKPLTISELRPRRRRGSDLDEWRRYYYRGRNGDMTFLQAEALYAKEHNWFWPERKCRLMPASPSDWCRKIRDVPKEELL